MSVTRALGHAIVRHFMENTPSSESFEIFNGKNPRMLDSKIMMTHYSAEVLFSDDARAKFVEPNLDPIPRYTSASRGPLESVPLNRTHLGAREPVVLR